MPCTGREETFHLDLNVRKELVKCYILSIALYGAETKTLRKIEIPGKI
jgi:hypothetical protein